MKLILNIHFLIHHHLFGPLFFNLSDVIFFFSITIPIIIILFFILSFVVVTL